MKNILKTIIKILALCFALTLVNCEKDDAESINNSEKVAFTVKEYSFETANEKPKFKESFSKVKKGVTRSASNERSTSELSIDSTTIKEIEINGITSYTILVNSEEQEDNSFENLIIQVDSLETVKAYLITYYPTNLEYHEEHDSYSFQGTQEIERIDYDSSFINLSVLDFECTSILMCDYGADDFGGSVHVAGANCGSTFWGPTECTGGGGSGGNGEGDGPSGSGGSPFTAPVFPIERDHKQQLINCLGTLDIPIQEWLNKSENALSVKAINNYLNPSSGYGTYLDNCNPETQAFALEAIEAKMEGGEFDGVNNIILDSTVINNQKVKCVYDKLKGLSNTIFNDIIDNHFGSSNDNHVKITLGNIPAQLGAGTIAYTSTNFISGSTNSWESGDVKNIRIDPNFVANASTIEIALVLIHELIHAELLDRCIKLGLIQQTNALGFTTFTGNLTSFDMQAIIFNQLLIHYNTFPSPSNVGNTQWNHELFNGLNYRTKLAQNLTSIHALLNDTSNDFLTNVNNDLSIVGGPYTIAQLMEYISWIGLEATQEYATSIGVGTTAESEKLYIENASNTKYTKTCIN